MKRHPLKTPEYKQLKMKRMEYSFQGEIWFNLMQRFAALTPREIEPILGKQDCVFRGEYNVKIWVFEMEEQLFAILSAPGRGTTLESSSTNQRLLYMFAKKLEQLLLSTQS